LGDEFFYEENINNRDVIIDIISETLLNSNSFLEDKGLQNTSVPKPDQIYLLSQARRATIDDQRVLLEWLLQKFKLDASPKP